MSKLIFIAATAILLPIWIGIIMAPFLAYIAITAATGTVPDHIPWWLFIAWLPYAGALLAAITLDT